VKNGWSFETVTARPWIQGRSLSYEVRRKQINQVSKANNHPENLISGLDINIDNVPLQEKSLNDNKNE